MTALENQITDIFNKMTAKDEVKRYCSHDYKYIGYVFGRIDYHGTIGIMKIFRCKCGDELYRDEKPMAIPKGKIMWKIYK